MLQWKSCTCRKPVSKDCWEKLEGTFSLSGTPDQVVFYLEGPLPGVDLLIKSVVITCSSSLKCEVSIPQSPVILFVPYGCWYFQLVAKSTFEWN